MSAEEHDVEAGNGEEEVQPKGRTMMDTVLALTATATIGTSVAAMALVGSPIVIAAGVLSSLMGPYVYFQQKSLKEIQALKETQAAVEKEVGELGNQNNRLEDVVKNLTGTVGKLEDVEAALDVITQTQGQSVEEFREQIEENKKILAKMESNLKGNVLQNMLSVIVRCDKDGDFTIDPDELEDLIARMKEIHGVTVYEDRFREKVKASGGSLRAVMDVVRTLLMDEDNTDDPIFTLSSD